MSRKEPPTDDRPALILVRDGATGDKWYDVAYYDCGWRFYRDSLTAGREGATVERWRYCHEAIVEDAR